MGCDRYVHNVTIESKSRRLLVGESERSMKQVNNGLCIRSLQSARGIHCLIHLTFVVGAGPQNANDILGIPACIVSGFVKTVEFGSPNNTGIAGQLYLMLHRAQQAYLSPCLHASRRRH